MSKVKRKTDGLSYYRDFVQKCSDVGHTFNSDEFVFALLKIIGFNNADAMSIARRLPNDKPTLDKRKSAMSQSGILYSAKGQVKFLSGLLENMIDKLASEYIEDHKLVEIRFNEYKEEEAKDKKKNLENKKLSELSKLSVNLDTLNEMAIMVFKELKRRDISEFDTKEFKDIMEILAKCTKQLDTSDPTQDRIDKAIVTTYPPFNVVCPHCSREGYAAPEMVTRCQNCNEFIDCRPMSKRGDVVDIYELPEEYHNYWKRNYSGYFESIESEEED